MDTFMLSGAIMAVFFVWYFFNGRKLKDRIERIRRVQVHGPDARICYMNMSGKKYIWQIAIESVKPRGQDWVVTAWCYEKKEFLEISASRIYEYFDLIRFKEIKNVPAYFTERFSHKHHKTS